MALLKADVLSSVHPRLAAIVRLAASRMPFDVQVIQGARTAAQHAANVKKGVTRTTRSRHVKANNKAGVACAVDMAPSMGGTIPWQRADLFKTMNTIMQAAGKELGTPVEWGGNWKTFKDLNHWQLPWKTFP